jgi:tetratricopeptide (TPR) repeat protein
MAHYLFIWLQYHYSGAEVFLDQALKLKEEHLGANHADIEIILSMKANLFQRQGMYAKALPLCQRALQIVESNPELRKDGIRSPVIKTTIAGLLKEDGKYEEAEKMFLEAYKEKQLVVGDKALLIAASM